MKQIVENVDCMDFMRRFPDGYFDLAVVDPPYGIGAHIGTNREAKNKFKHKKQDRWDDFVPSKEYFDKLISVSEKQIIWGGGLFYR